ncbi:hypothetical protein [Microbispora sp. NPDC049125]|uniref:hypothetical protein n=1 Tax=Microbispora sp. NPDC049125 TaxID=3154929 RepID=UPI003465EA38
MTHSAPLTTAPYTTGGRGPLARAAALGMAVLTGCCLLTACGSGSGSARTDAAVGDAASLITLAAGTATASPSDKAATDAGVQLRLDSSPEEVTRARMGYATCLKAHRAPSTIKTTGVATSADEAAQKAAEKACAGKRPLLPPEMDPRTNPHYADAVRVQVKCMKDHGFKVHITPAQGSDPNAIGWIYDRLPGPGVDIQKVQDDCRARGFGGGAAVGPAPE